MSSRARLRNDEIRIRISTADSEERIPLYANRELERRDGVFRDSVLAEKGHTFASPTGS